MPGWNILTNHALVLVHVTRHPRSTLRQIAQSVDITERSALSILRSLEADRIVGRRRVGRRNVYSVDLEALAEMPIHPYTLGELAGALLTLTSRKPLPSEVYAEIDRRRAAESTLQAELAGGAAGEVQSPTRV